MKIIKKIILFTSILLVLAGCKYEDFVTDFTFSSVYFPRQTNTRSFVVGENQSIEIGVVMGGKIGLNNPEQSVEFVIDPTLLVGKGLTLIPRDYYTLSDSSHIIIPTGKVQGAIIMTIDTAKFLNDPLAAKAKYALPLRIVNTSIDSILPSKSTEIITLKFENKHFGNYYHNGVVEITTTTSTQTTYYHQEEPVTNAVNNWILTTTGPYSVLTNGIINIKGGINVLSLTIAKDNTIRLKNNPISPIIVSPNGPCNYNPVKKEFYLQYKYTNAGKTYSAKDTLIFRNRILDGVNQW
jgi:hypothetical protein